MSHRVRRDEELKAVQVFQDVLLYNSLVQAFGRPREYPLQHFEQKSASAGGKVQHGDALAVGQTLANAKGLLENILYGLDDEADHRRRSVVHAAPFSRLLVVRTQKILVEIHIRVFVEQQPLFLSGVPRPLGKGEVGVNGRQVERVHNAEDLFQQPLDVLVLGPLQLV